MKRFFKKFTDLFVEHRISMSSAALSYYVTMTFFPILICLYTMLGQSSESIDEILTFAETIMPGTTIDYVRRFFNYVEANYSFLMMFLAITVVLLSASAGIRSIENTIGKLQGGRRFYGYYYFLLSIVISVLFVIVVYLAIMLMFLSKNFISFINKITPGIEISQSWTYLRYIILFFLAFSIIYLIYGMCKRKDDHYQTFIGTFISTLLLILISYVFSKILNYTIKYPLVYGSLASIILLMFYLYCMCLSIYIGATLNITIRDLKNKTEES